MASEWNNTTLGSLLKFANGRSSPPRSDDYPVRVYGSNGVIGHCQETNAEAETIIIGRVGSYCGSTYQSRDACWVTDNAIKANPLPGNDSRFLFYLLDTLDLNSRASGSGQPLLNQSILSSIDVVAPPLPEQKAIAHILGSLDDKIELNRRMNATLEGMAQALFKSWFVDFDPVIDNALEAGNPIPEVLAARARLCQGYAGQAETQEGVPTIGKTAAEFSNVRKLFPAAFQKTDEMGWIPEGWEDKSIEDCIQRFPVGKKYANKTAEEKGIVPILDQGKSGLIGYHNDEPGVTASPDDPIIVFANHTCYMRLVMFDFSAIQNVLPFKGDGLNIFWLYEATKGRQKFNEYKGHWPDLMIKRIVVPSDPLVSHFGQIVEANYRKIYANDLESQTLSNLRDTLLPKLISGELRLSAEASAQAGIEDAEKMVGEVA